MRSKQKLLGIVLLVVLVVAASAWGLSHYNFAVLNPAGVMAQKERQLMIIASLLSLIVVIPVFILLGTFAWKYSERNQKPGKYAPDEDGNRKLETVWWLIPSILLVVLSTIIWRSSHALDPFKPLDSSKTPVRVQVVSLEWKWLFIYPDEGVASVNALPLPVDRPVNFEITSDAPMNSFWIPQLSGQIYAMSGMSTKLHIEANKIGSYDGRSANISGEGFAGMTFKANVMSQGDYDAWVERTRTNENVLNQAAYDQLALPSQNVKPAVYVLGKHDLYDTIVMKYMSHENTGTDTEMAHDMAGMEM